MPMDVLEVLKATAICTLKLIYFCWEAVFFYFFPIIKDVKGKVVLITGAGSGIGRLVAMRFAKLGCKVVIWDINEDGNTETARLVRLSSKEGGEAHPYICDVGNKDAVYETAKRVMQDVGSVDILINNAGIVTGKSFLNLKDDNIVKTFEVNALSNFWTCKAFLPDMMNNNAGHIVSIASIAALFGGDNLSDYCSSKAAVKAFHDSLSVEMKGKGYTGIDFTVVLPYFINTGMFNGIDSLFPIAEPDYVAEKIVSSILTSKSSVLLPNYFLFFFLLKYVIPEKGFLLIHEMLNGHKLMKSFKGHSK